MSEVRVRFAPSPTGYLHIGGARTALYNWLFARKHGGAFVLRIEDTDAERSTVESAQAILDQLRWLGLDWDEGPNYQSTNVEKHKEAARRLLEEGKAYRCFCTREELEAKREIASRNKADYRYDGTCRRLSPADVEANLAAAKPFVVRFKVPQKGGSVVFEDMIQGPNEKAHADLEDFVILRSDGRPLYLLSNCVDDAVDRITHVIRGQDGMANTPKQVLIYQALGHPVPRFAHMALTMDMKGRKISKRVHGLSVSVGFFRDRGFLPWALCNALILLGWSAGDDREYYTREELVEAFNLEGCTRTNSKFGVVEEDKITDGMRDWTDAKALRINATYLRRMSLDDLLPLVREVLMDEGIRDPSRDAEPSGRFRDTVDLIRERFFTLRDFATLGRSYFSDEFDFDEAAVRKNLKKNPDTPEHLLRLADAYEAAENWDLETLERVLRELAEESGVKAGVFINGARVALTGQPVGPGMFHVMMALGRERTIRRLRDVGAKAAS